MEVFQYTLTEDDLFENIITDERLVLNHVVLEARKRFPRHNTDAIVYMIVARGTIALKAKNLEKRIFTRGDVIKLPFDVPSELYNPTDDIGELFVVKLQP